MINLWDREGSFVSTVWKVKQKQSFQPKETNK